MANTELDIRYVANLARVALTPEEEARFGSQLEAILGYVKKLEELVQNGMSGIITSQSSRVGNNSMFKQSQIIGGNTDI